MNTITLTLSTQWQKVSDDSKTVMMQLMSGDAAFCVSVNKPADDADWHFMPHLELITITPPTSVWARSTHIYKTDTRLTVSTVE